MSDPLKFPESRHGKVTRLGMWLPGWCAIGHYLIYQTLVKKIHKPFNKKKRRKR